MRVAFAIVAIATGGLGAVAGGGCSEPTGPRSVRSEQLTVKIPAIKEAARSGDMSAAPQLVEDLGSDDAAVRLYAFEALRELAGGGETHGYVYYADYEQRRAAVAKWQQWLQQQGAATRPARQRGS
jgi:hypothetical protein